jgi:hypothetical protein
MKRKTNLLVLKTAIFACLIALTGTSCSHHPSTTDGEIMIVSVNKKFRTINDLKKSEEFRDKNLYITLWTSDSDNCMDYFGHDTELKRSSIDKNLEFIYLSTDGKSLKNKQIRVIEKYNLTGYHLNNYSWNLMEELISYSNQTGTYPVILFINVKGQVRRLGYSKSGISELLLQIDDFLLIDQ